MALAQSTSLSLVIKVEADHQAAAGLIRSSQQRRVACLRLCIFVVECQSTAAEHDRIPAIADRERVHVAEIRRRLQCRVGLPRHVYQFVASGKDKLWVYRVVGFYKAAVPRRA